MDWREAGERLRAPVFAPLAPALERLPRDRWPTHADLNTLAAGIRTARGMPVRFVPPRPAAGRERRPYELHIAATGEVETRPANWHDLFNALAWVAYPRAKARINEQHAALLEARGESESRRRSPERDALTLFDEGGVAVASSDASLLRLIVDFEWKTLFWQRRGDVLARMRFFAFGHACHEQSLAPYLGMVAKTVLVPVEESFLALPPARQVAAVDERLAAHFADPARFPSPRALPPMPVLGIPGWHPGNQAEAFYDDADHFRSKPRARKVLRK